MAKEQNSQQKKEYNLKQQCRSAIFICGISLVGFLPYMLGLEFHFKDDDTEVHSSASTALITDVSNAAIASCTAMMWIEALLDSFTLYIPIRVAFPRFLMVCGVLSISVSLYFFDYEENERLHYTVCMQYAKGYFVCGGLLFKLLADAVDRKSRQRFIYFIAIIVYTGDSLSHQWDDYYSNLSPLLVLGQYVLTLCSVLVSVYFAYSIAQIVMPRTTWNVEGSYRLMSHSVICIMYFGTYIVTYSFPAKTWQETSGTQLAAYNLVCLVSITVFFFSTSQIAQRHFVTAENQLVHKKSFVRYVSHEIRTPLNTVYLGIQMLTADLRRLVAHDKSVGGNFGKQLSGLQSVVNDISASCSISISILNDLLLIDKIEEGNLNLEMKPENAKEMIAPCIQNFDVQAIFCNVNLSVDLEALSDITIHVDESKLSQVLRNIVSNALKFTPSGGHIQMKSYFTPDTDAVRGLSPIAWGGSDQVHVDQIHGKIRLEFLDTGPGITEENKAKLFENVVQFNPNLLQKGGGSGLGLFISNAIMKRHDGGVIGIMPGGVEETCNDCDSEKAVKLISKESASSGCVFYIEMDGVRTPCDETDNVVSVSMREKNFSSRRRKFARKDSSLCNTPSSSCAGQSFNFNRVLVVEDSKLNQKMMVKALSSYAKEVVTATDGLEGVAAVRKSVENQEIPFDVIFMDSLMPHMNGIDATKIIVNELGFSSPIIAVTGNLLPEDVKEFEAAGVLKVMGKPLELDKLDEILQGIHASNMSNASGRQTRRRFSIVSQHPEYDVVDIDEGDGDGDDDSV